ncbi:transcription factor e(y)2-domain-containing protein [Dipodascopsis uninucleata]
MADDETKAKVHQKLIDSGEYERISTHLRQKLVEAGWYQKVNELAAGNIRSQESPNFEKLVNEVEPRALAMIPDEIKIEILNMIKNFLETIVE